MFWPRRSKFDAGHLCLGGPGVSASSFSGIVDSIPALWQEPILGRASRKLEEVCRRRSHACDRVRAGRRANATAIPMPRPDLLPILLDRGAASFLHRDKTRSSQACELFIPTCSHYACSPPGRVRRRHRCRRYRPFPCHAPRTSRTSSSTRPSPSCSVRRCSGTCRWAATACRRARRATSARAPTRAPRTR